MQKKVLGLIIIIVGILLLLPVMGVNISSGEIIGEYWPVILIVFGIMNLISKNSSKTGGTILLVLGILFLMDTMNVYRYGFDLWSLIFPAIIIIVGVRMLFPGVSRSKEPTSINYIRQTVLFSGAEVKNNATEFKGGDINAIFGGMELDLTNTKVAAEKPAVINALVMFGGIDLMVPKEWKVEVRGLPVFGGWSNKTEGRSEEKALDLVVNATVMFGGLGVENKKEKLNG